ncbi:DNA replication and repair protein RecO [Chitinophaga terrae (ex Kim and Jung 2007)]|jgi:DNA repair protein RecO (recombination protein O)|uniref:DNA repair protein RecO n=1 Tax=Chitinophaga terrae (ex Kim and Jung 2007) TaxID=408074 RepID=A0A1H4F962_9BACT|nr:DNA repair protein RecO [Chitinophaga terrae (ex Kim and Jung 2007)]GEP92299.1 DNA repair protein RecO [Chitinophaga terrae (ex Kim and Jung 2007)]SEA93853.1 DNA replication and repair protein RecO [Chitinophaga terrae (ex Kim and Jung 2007)]
MLHKTRGIVLRAVKYGDTSLILSVFTELFGLQSYIVNGARSSKPKAAKGNLLQPGNILEMVVYHQDIKNIHRISEFKLGHIYTSVQLNVVKNTVALYIIELLQKCLKQPEQHLELYYFTENTLRYLDLAPMPAIANLPLYYTLKVGEQLGFRLNGHFSEYTPFLDLQEGTFTDLPPHHSYHLDPECSELTDRIFRCAGIPELVTITMSKDKRRRLLYAYLDFFQLHLPDFTEMHSPPILHEILDA